MSDNKISRYKEREQAFFICFEKLFSDASISEISECAEESRDDNYSEFALECAKGVEDNLEEIDKIISSHLSAKWKLNRISKVSLSILRLAVYEMKYVEDIFLIFLIDWNTAVLFIHKITQNFLKICINGCHGNIRPWNHNILGNRITKIQASHTS